MSIILWIILGAIAGWIASMIMGRNGSMGWLGNIIVGIVGAFIGALVWHLITGAAWAAGFNIGTLLIAIVGAIVLLFIWNLVTSSRA
ncbi:MAG TPA: GlsB/YeaQ/YmgE family stress response membrane protein [Thermomicrobiaceae bacterium]|nr:GlsB/YeaQ/YmgE family stress response membrane protein [Thermomicrobiaceae bacterium]